MLLSSIIALHYFMKRFKAVGAILVIVGLSLLANAIWLYEIAVMHDWHSLAWLYTPLYSPYIISLLPALAYVAGYRAVGLSNKYKSRSLLIITLLYLINLGFYFTGKWYCYASFGRFGLLWVSVPFGIVICMVIFLGLGFCYRFVTGIIMQQAGLSLIIMAGLTLLVIPLSLATFILIPGLGGPGSFIDGVKMGYPVFWITFLIGLCGMLAARKQKG